MKKLLILSLMVAGLLALAALAAAAPLKVYVGEFTVVGAPDKDQLKPTLQTLLASRLDGDPLLSVDQAAGADYTVAGNYTVFGKVFSLDATVRDSAGKVKTRVFEQGEGQDDLLPAITKLAQKVRGELIRATSPVASAPTPPVPVAQPGPAATAPVAAAVAVAAAPAAPPPAAPAVAAPAPAPAAVAAKAQPPADIIMAPAIPPTQPGDIVRAPVEAQQMAAVQRLPGALVGIAPVRTLPDGSRELYVVGDRVLRLYRLGAESALVDQKELAALSGGRGPHLYSQGREITLLDEKEFGSGVKILAVDSADLDGDSTPEAYVTIYSGGWLLSEIWVAREGKLQKLAEKLPYYFRGIALAGREKKIYAQQVGVSADFFGDLSELAKTTDGYELINPIKLPRFGFLYNFNQFSGIKGELYSIVTDPDGLLIVTTPNGESVWRGVDNFGGSETFFKRDDLQNMQFTGTEFRWVFLQQRITVTPTGEVIIPRNGGFWVVGNARNYGKSSIYAFAWNGVSLVEKWHTKENPTYLADYFYDHERRELVQLEVVQHEGLFAKGYSAITVRRVE